MIKTKLKDLADQVLAKDRRILSKVITLVENGGVETLEILEHLYPHCGNCKKIGITGPPGAGKSTLVDQLITYIREKLGKKVGVIAVDPSSPFTGGALLGDRIRMQTHHNDDNVFIRSLSNRGHRGGISLAARLLTTLYDAFGFDYVIIETVGVGQSEVDIMELADTTCVVLVPESGDTIQTMKAGLLEIADIFIVNKSDREGALAIADELKQMVSIENCSSSSWRVPTIMVQATSGKGIDEIFHEMGEHASFLLSSKDFQERKGLLKKREVIEITLSELKKGIEGIIESSNSFKNEIMSKNSNPFTIAKKIAKKMKKK